MALPKPREQNDFAFSCFLTEEMLTDAFCDRPEAAESVQYLWKLNVSPVWFLILKNKQPLRKKKRLPNQKQLKVLTFLYYKLMLS